MNCSPILSRELIEYSKTDYYPFHMPGHKRVFSDLYHIDITEIEGFDNLHHPEGIIGKSMEWAASIYGADKTYYLVNGSSGGILSAISGSVPDNGKILMGRNCHKAAYHGVILKHLKPVYICPQYMEEYGILCGLSPVKIEQLLKENMQVKAVLVVSPTYDGIVSDIGAISEICHRYEIPLIVDEAHGAHFRYGDMFPVSALELGADVVIQSVHKTLPCFTQSALLHIKEGYVNREKIEQYLQVYQSSSPSYILMAGIEEGIWWMEQDEGRKKMKDFSVHLLNLRQELSNMKNLKILGQEVIGSKDIYDLDLSKIIVSTKNSAINGMELSEKLRDEYHLEMEMCTKDYVTAITTVMDTEDGMRRLKEALLSIDQSLDSNKNKSDSHKFSNASKQWEVKSMVSMDKAWNGAYESILLENSVGRIVSEFIYLYPPGIPIVAPGELMTKHIIEIILEYKNMELPIQGMRDRTNKTISVLKEGES